ncbi:MAG: hypothetical protein M1836_004539 [Candelina mexicana]|nr:MAG: hypothetical protein M1836_004539 [Candelina mexicana]
MANQSEQKNGQEIPPMPTAKNKAIERRVKHSPVIDWSTYKTGGVTYTKWRGLVVDLNVYDDLTDDDVDYDWSVEIDEAQKAGHITAEEATALDHERHAPSSDLQIWVMQLKFNHLFSESYADKIFPETAPIPRGTAEYYTSYFVLELSSKQILYIPDILKVMLDDLSPEKFFDTLAGLNSEAIPREMATGVWEYAIESIHKNGEYLKKSPIKRMVAYGPSDVYWKSELSYAYVKPDLLILPVPVKDQALNENAYVKLVRFTQYLNPNKLVDPKLMESAWIAYRTVHTENFPPATAYEQGLTANAESLLLSNRIRRWWIAVERSQLARLEYEMVKFIPHDRLDDPRVGQAWIDSELSRPKFFLDLMIIVAQKTICIPLCKAMQFYSFPDYINFDKQLPIINAHRNKELAKRTSVDYLWKVASGYPLQAYLWATDEAGKKMADNHWAEKEEEFKQKLLSEALKEPQERKLSRYQQMDQEIKTLKRSLIEKDGLCSRLEQDDKFKNEHIDYLEQALDDKRLQSPPQILGARDTSDTNSFVMGSGRRIELLEDRVRLLLRRQRGLVKYNEQLAQRIIVLEKSMLDSDTYDSSDESENSDVVGADAAEAYSMEMFDGSDF